MFQVRASEVGRLGPKTRSTGAVERLTPWHPIWIGMFVEKDSLQAQSFRPSHSLYSPCPCSPKLQQLQRNCAVGVLRRIAKDAALLFLGGL